MKYYEAVYILDSTLSDEKFEELLNSITEELAGNGEIFAIDRLGTKHLAHPVKKVTEGQYVIIYFSQEPAEIAKLQSRYKLNSLIIRMMILSRKEEELIKMKEKLTERSRIEKESPADTGSGKAAEVETPGEESPETPVEETPAEEGPVVSSEETPAVDEPANEDVETEKTE